MRFSHRVETTEPNRIAQAVQQARQQQNTIQSSNDSNPTHHGLAPEVLPQEYVADPRGPRHARELLSDVLQHRTDPDHLYLLNSTSQGYAWLMMLLCDAGDTILAPKPGYPLIESLARLNCVNVVNYHLQYDGSWTIDIAQLEALCAADTEHRIRAICVINPNNPTGSYVKAEEREAIIDICQRYDLAIIADEVFYDYELEPFASNRRFATESRVLTFALDGLSKMLAAPHAKVGWIEVSGPEDEVREAQARLDMIADDFLPIGQPLLSLLPSLLDAVPNNLQRVQERTRTNLQLLRSALQSHESGVVSLLRPEGGWNVLVRMPSVIDENELVIDMIKHDHLTGQPGYFFDMDTNGYLAISLLPEPEVFQAQIDAVLSAVDRALRMD